MWRRCSFDEWHLDCEAGGVLDLNSAIATRKDHDYIAAVRRKEDGTLEFVISSSQTKAFDSNSALNGYLRALGLEELTVVPNH